MKSWTIGRIAGIAIRLHPTFLVFLGWIALARSLDGGSPRVALGAIALTIAVFAIIVLHELGHAFAALAFGIRTVDITLLPIGGVARLERIPERPHQELIVAVAGPAVNVALAVLLGGAVVLRHGVEGAMVSLAMGSSFLGQLALVNVALAVFNMIPAFPMDGGRAFRAAAALVWGRVRATEIAARLGRALAVAFGLVGLLVNPMLIFIALFVWMGATEEERSTRLHVDLEGVPVDAALARHFIALDATESVAEALDRTLGYPQRELPVMGADRAFIGTVGRPELLNAELVHGPAAHVGPLARVRAMPALAGTSLLAALDRVRPGEAESIPVVDASGELIGIVTGTALGDLLDARALERLQRLREKRPPRGPAPVFRVPA